jgi:hypothetical protein
VAVELEYERAEPERSRDRLRTLGPRDQFATYYRSAHGAEPAGRLLAAFDRVYAEVAEGTG